MIRFTLRLFVAGSTARSVQAISNLRRFCDEVLEDRCDLEIIDVLEHPVMAEQDRIIATPTLLRLAPLPPRRIIGDLSDRGRILQGLDLTGS